MPELSMILVWVLALVLAAVVGAYAVSAPWQTTAGGRGVMVLLLCLLALTTYVGFSRYVDTTVRHIVLDVLMVALIVAVGGLGRAILSGQILHYRKNKIPKK